jgi:hypothetical protein
VKSAPFFAGRKGLRLLLGHANEHHLIAHAALLAQPLGHLVLTLPVLEMNPRDALLGRPALYCLHPTLGDLAQQCGRRNGLAQMLGQETDQSSPGCEAGEIAVQIQPIDAFDFQVT